MSCEPPVPAGTELIGKWRRRRYLLERVIGAGAGGTVYLSRHGKARFAVKIGNDPFDFQSEVNALLSLERGRNPQDRFLVDVDDFHWRGRDYPFYVMPYIEGYELAEYLRRCGRERFPLIGYRLLNKLARLHEQGWVFGDLKPENIMVGDGGRVELVDYGGVTPVGRAVKQFTEWYDRGYWRAGGRTGDAAYDLFSFAVLCCAVADRGRFKSLVNRLRPAERSPDQLLRWMKQEPMLAPYAAWFAKALRGEFTSGQDAAQQWKRLTMDAPHASDSAGIRRGAFEWPALLLAASLVLLVITLGLLSAQ
jgi:serine/threonine-protein kinase